MKRIRIALGDGQFAHIPTAEAAELTFRMPNGNRMRVQPQMPLTLGVTPGVVNVPLTSYALTQPAPSVRVGNTFTVPLTTYTLTQPEPTTSLESSEAPVVAVSAVVEGQVVSLTVVTLYVSGYDLSVTVGGVAVTPASIGPGSFAVDVPPASTDTIVAWTASATNVVGSTSVTGQITVPGNLTVPGAPGTDDWFLTDTVAPPSAPNDGDWLLIEEEVVATAPEAPGTDDWELTNNPPDPPPPPGDGTISAPQSVAMTTLNDRSFSITWSAPATGTAASYRLQYSTDQSFWTTIQGVTSPYTLDNLPLGDQRYYVRVIAVSAANQSATSAAVNAKTHVRPYGLTAEWNLPIADVVGRGAHPNETYLRDVLWQGRGLGPGVNWLNFFNRDYTYPVYYASRATTVATVAVGFGNWVGRQVPWNPSWVIPGGTDNQIILLNEATGEEFNAWRIRYDASTNRIVNAPAGTGRFSRVTADLDGSATAAPADYRTKVNGFVPSRGMGLQYLALLIRPEEIAQGKIYHALGIVMHRSGYAYHCRPAYKSERSGGALTNNRGVPQGTRFYLDVSEAEIDAHIASWPSGVTTATRNTMKIVFTAMAEYGFIANDIGGDNHIQFEHDASADWTPYGLDEYTVSRTWPRDAIDGFISDKSKLKVVRPPDGVLHYARWSGETNRAPTPLDGNRPDGVNMTTIGFPAISGTPTVGATLTRTRPGQFFGEHPVTVTHQWRRGSTNIAGATGSTYTVQAADQGFTITCRALGTNAAGTNTIDSNGIFIP